MNRRLTFLLDLLHPDLNKEMKAKKNKQVEAEEGRHVRIFQEDLIFETAAGPPCIPPAIVKPAGPVSYKTRSLVDGVLSKRHMNQVRSRIDQTSTGSSSALLHLLT